MYSQNNEPYSIKLAKWLIIIRLSLAFVIIMFTLFFIVNGEDQEGFLQFLKRMFFHRLGIDIQKNASFNLGLLSGVFLLPTAALLAQLILLHTRKRYLLLLTIIGLEIVLSILKGIIPIVGFIILILVVLENSRQYLIPKPIRNRKENILDDLEF